MNSIKMEDDIDMIMMGIDRSMRSRQKGIDLLGK
jgi:hypothetical protein